ncbi:hypothetical protein BASA60_006344 [Batrachochytrium salamandrivorans]|nr:hypothetical protein BASA62_005028 [Batrachochytrium salamandrivorans]KAH6572932.1 hypothetical protein BASA60_006344 [Batrachochytrium salamandrivorans]
MEHDPLSERPLAPPALFFRLRLPEKPYVLSASGLLSSPHHLEATLAEAPATNLVNPNSTNSTNRTTSTTPSLVDAITTTNIETILTDVDGVSADIGTPSFNTPHAIDSPADLLQSFRYSSQDLRMLQSPLRSSPNKQAAITTDGYLVIRTANVALCRSIQVPQNEIVGRSILNFIAPNYRKKYAAFASSARSISNPSNTADAVLVCGSVVRLIRSDQSTFPVSLWLKERGNSANTYVLLWVFEEIDEMQSEVVVSYPEGKIMHSKGDVLSTFGYESSELQQLSLASLLPKIRLVDGEVDFDQLQHSKYFASTGKNGFSFPVIVKIDHPDPCIPSASLLDQPPSIDTSVSLQPNSPSATDPSAAISTRRIQIIAMPHIAGVVTIHHTGVIHSINNEFAKYLFGHSAAKLVHIVSITDILPTFWSAFEGLSSVADPDNISLSGISSTLRCSSPTATSPTSPNKILPGHETSYSWTVSSGSITIPCSMSATGLTAKHRDGSDILVDAHARPLVLGGHKVFAIWITYRAHYTSLVQPLIFDTTLPTLQSLTVRDGPPESPPYAPLFSDKAIYEVDRDGTTSEFLKLEPLSESLESCKEPGSTPNPPSLLSLITPSSTPPCAPTESTKPVEPSEPSSIDDYTVIKSIGEGAYGFIRLAHRTLDPEKSPLVIKYIVKTRVLSWCRREDLGGRIPIEVAILHDMKKDPHPNIVKMVDYFQDDFYVYIIMCQCGDMDLFQFIESNPIYPEVLVRKIFHQVMLSVQHLHAMDIVHRDIKDENVVIDVASHEVTLIDFGSSAYRVTGKPFSTFFGTMDFAAP